MRRIICSAAISATFVASLVGLSMPAANAADSKVTVHGQDLADAGLRYNSGSCSSWATDPINNGVSDVYALYKKPGLIGQRAIGWQFGPSGGATGTEAGPLAPVNSPAKLSNVRFSGYMRSPDPQAGLFTAYLAPDGDFGDGYYAGSSGYLSTTASGWSTWSHLETLDLTWYHWNGGGFDAGSTVTTIKALARSAGNAATAYVGPELGCDGKSWYVDDLRVSTGRTTRTYDFEGARTGSVLGGWHKLSDPPRKVVWGLKHFVRDYSESDWVVGYGGYYDDLTNGAPFTYFRGPGTLFAKPYGSKRFHKVATKTFTVKGVAAFKLKHLTRHTDYYFSYPGNTARSPSRSQTMSVDVRAEVHGHLLNKSVFRGARLAVAGQRLPGDAGAKVLLQRKVRGHWRTIGSSRTHRHGNFRVGARAGSLGIWNLRLSVPGAKGDLGNQTGAFAVRIKKRPAPPPPPPVITSPPPCTTCAGAPPDVPIGGKLGGRRLHPRGPIVTMPLEHGRSPRPAPGRGLLRDPAQLPGRRSAGR